MPDENRRRSLLSLVLMASLRLVAALIAMAVITLLLDRWARK